MSINSQRAALRRSAINLDRIRRSLRNFGQGIKSAKIQSDEILKQTRERNRFKSSLINRDDKFFRLRQENIKRKNREDALEATTINGSTKLQGSILQKSSRGFLGRMLDFLGILLIGWSIRNLPRIIEGIEKLKKNITDAVGILTDFMGGVTDALLGIGAGLSDFFTQFRRFDFSLNRRSIMEQVDKIINNSVLLNKNLVTAFNNFENDPDLNKAIENMDEDSADGEDNEEDRLVQYICYLPKSHPKNTEAMKKKRLKYYKEQRTTSHWPCPIKVNGLQPRTFGNDDILIDYDSLPMNDLSEYEKEIMKII